MTEVINNPKGSYKLYRISNKFPASGHLMLDSVDALCRANSRDWEYIASTSMEEAIEAWKTNPTTTREKVTPVSVELVCASLKITKPE